MAVRLETWKRAGTRHCRDRHLKCIIVSRYLSYTVATSCATQRRPRASRSSTRAIRSLRVLLVSACAHWHVVRPCAIDREAVCCKTRPVLVGRPHFTANTFISHAIVSPGSFAPGTAYYCLGDGAWSGTAGLRLPLPSFPDATFNAAFTTLGGESAKLPIGGSLLAFGNDVGAASV